MSLQYVIDGYNIIKHPLFTKQLIKTREDSRIVLLDFIRINRLCGSLKNKVTVVFDGHRDSRYPDHAMDIQVIFSRNESADERIKQIVTQAPNVKNILVVSDDKEIRLFSRAYGALVQSIEEFLKVKERQKGKREDSSEPEITYSQMHKINDEFRKIWLK